MIDFFDRVQKAFQSVKLPLLIVTGFIALIQIFLGSYFSNEDRRQTMNKIVGLIIFAGLIMYAERFFEWIEQIFK